MRMVKPSCHAAVFAKQADYGISLPIAVGTADVNGDGKLDLLAGSINNNSINVYLGNGDGSFRTATSVNLGRSLRSMDFADINGDGKPDIVATTYDDVGVAVVLANGDGSFQPRIDLPCVTRSIS
jgi:hypothetical protein